MINDRSRLGEILVVQGALDQTTLDLALAHIDGLDGPRPKLGSHLTKQGLVSESQVAEAFAQQVGLEFMELGRLNLDPILTTFVPRRLARRDLMVPIGKDDDGVLIVAMADPTNVIAVDDLRAVLGEQTFRPVVATGGGVLDAITRLYQLGGVTEALDLDPHSGAFDGLGWAPDAIPDDPAVDVDSAPIVQLVHSMFSDAVRAGATDIHVEPAQESVKIRFRIDGILRESATLPAWVKRPALSRIKVMAGMDIAEQRRPQDGRGRIRVDSQHVDIRASTIPTIWGEKAVLRLLPRGDLSLDLSQIGMASSQLAHVEKYLAMPQGLIIFTGPTGSGKTTSMYATLRRIDATDRNMVTLEDPVEYEMPGINQIQVDEKIGLSFARGLRAVLRQDPDVIMVGEIRDGETARIVMQASMTGHVVFSTLHTNDAASAVTRLIDIGVEPFLVASSLSLVVAQRLLRVVCNNCKRPSTPTEWTLGLLGLSEQQLRDATLVGGEGCDECGYTGFRGRTGIFEVLPVTKRMRELISNGASSAVINVAAQADGMFSLRRSALQKAFAGITSLEEVVRVTQFDKDDTKSCTSCGREVERTFQVCPFCGEGLEGKNCERCGSKIAADWDSCAFCGNDLLARSEASPTVESIATTQPVGPTQARTAEGSGDGRLRVLVVDHDARSASLIKFMLEPKYEVKISTGGDDALAEASGAKPDLMILSIALPDFSCEHTLTELARMPSTRGIPTMLLTEEGYETRELTCLEIGVKDILARPVKGEELRAKVASLIRRSIG